MQSLCTLLLNQIIQLTHPWVRLVRAAGASLGIAMKQNLPLPSSAQADVQTNRMLQPGTEEKVHIRNVSQQCCLKHSLRREDPLLQKACNRAVVGSSTI